MNICQRIIWCLAFLIVWQSFKSIGSIEQSVEPQKVPNFCFAQNLIETYMVSQKKGIDKKLLVGAAHDFNPQFLNLFGFSISVSFVWCII